MRMSTNQEGVALEKKRPKKNSREKKIKQEKNTVERVWASTMASKAKGNKKTKPQVGPAGPILGKSTIEGYFSTRCAALCFSLHRLLSPPPPHLCFNVCLLAGSPRSSVRKRTQWIRRANAAGAMRSNQSPRQTSTELAPLTSPLPQLLSKVPEQLNKSGQGPETRPSRAPCMAKLSSTRPF